LSDEALAGNTNDATTLVGLLDRIERYYGRAECMWVIDRASSPATGLSDVVAKRTTRVRMKGM
jgi:hypothetical protein